MRAQPCLQLLRRHGYTVLEAANGREALLLASIIAGQIHLLLTDVVMPKMSGERSSRADPALRPGCGSCTCPATPTTPIFRHDVLEDGIPFLQKPFTPEALARKVREVLDPA